MNSNFNCEIPDINCIGTELDTIKLLKSSAPFFRKVVRSCAILFVGCCNSTSRVEKRLNSMKLSHITCDIQHLHCKRKSENVAAHKKISQVIVPLTSPVTSPLRKNASQIDVTVSGWVGMGTRNLQSPYFVTLYE